MSGLLTQPIVGALSDSCGSRFGRRRPYIVGSHFLSLLALVLISYGREIGYGFRPLTSVEYHTKPAPKTCIAAVVFGFYLLDFAVNASQGCLRSLIVDTLHPSQQGDGNAWAAAMMGTGNIIGYLLGFSDLVSSLPWLGKSQLKVLCVLVMVISTLTIGLTCFFIKEKRFNSINPK